MHYLKRTPFAKRYVVFRFSQLIHYFFLFTHDLQSLLHFSTKLLPLIQLLQTIKPQTSKRQI